MKSVFRNNIFRRQVCSFATERCRREGFSLIESVAAVVVLGIVCSGVLVVFNRCMNSVADSKMKMQALEVARGNMEGLLTRSSVQEKVEYGTSEKYPEIEWETRVEPFYEPITEQMWVRAICTAEYSNSEDEKQEIELVHWLTNLTKQQLLKMIEQKEKSIEYTPDQLISDIDGAIEYTDTDAATIQEWVENGMPLSENGEFIKPQLDLYKSTGGNPSEQQRQESLLDLSQQEMAEQAQQSEGQDTEQPSQQDRQPSDSEGTEEAPDSQQDERSEGGQEDGQQQEQQQSNNPLGLPDGYQNWSINEIVQWLKENGHF